MRRRESEADLMMRGVKGNCDDEKREGSRSDEERRGRPL
jgi:hypothetical protein